MSSWHYKTWFKVFFYEKFFFKMSTGIILSPLTWLGFSPHYLGVLQRIFYIVWLKNPRSLWQKWRKIKTIFLQRFLKIANQTSEDFWIEKWKSLLFEFPPIFLISPQWATWRFEVRKKALLKITILSYYELKIDVQNPRRQ